MIAAVGPGSERGTSHWTGSAARDRGRAERAPCSCARLRGRRCDALPGPPKGRGKPSSARCDSSRPRHLPSMNAAGPIRTWCGRGESNPHVPFGTTDFKSVASTGSATPATSSALRRLNWRRLWGRLAGRPPAGGSRLRHSIRYILKEPSHGITLDRSE